jgi:hypothetical protein
MSISMASVHWYFTLRNDRADVISATITLSKPKLDCPKVLSCHLDMFSAFPFDPTPCPQEMVPAVLNLEMCSLIRSISKMASRFFEHSTTLTSTTAEVIKNTQVLSAIEHRLLSLEIPCSSGPPSKMAVLHVIEMSKIAALISTTY